MATLYAETCKKGKNYSLCKFREGRNGYMLNDKIIYIHVLEDFNLTHPEKLRRSAGMSSLKTG